MGFTSLLQDFPMVFAHFLFKLHIFKELFFENNGVRIIIENVVFHGQWKYYIIAKFKIHLKYLYISVYTYIYLTVADLWTLAEGFTVS